MRRNLDELRAELETRRVAYEKKRCERRHRLFYVASAVPVLVLVVALLPWGEWFSPILPDKDDPSSPPQSVAPVDPDEEREPGKQNEPMHGSASYRGGVDSFDELVEAADIIVLGTVISTVEPSSVTETATVRVEAVWRAPDGLPSEIYLYQMKDSHTVAVGNCYLLFLQVQTEGVLDGWYSIGGGQGTLLYDATSGCVSGYGVIDGEAATRWMEVNEPIIGTLP